MKKLLLLAIGIFLNTSGYAYDFEKDGIYYNITSLQDLTVEVTSGDNNYEGDVTIPDKVVYSGRTFIVTRIGENAFLSSSITGIGIPLSVVTVGKYAFRNCKQLRNILIPSSITTFEPGAFGGCNNLNNVVIEDGESGLSMPYNEWQVMNMSYFSNCNIQTLYYPKSEIICTQIRRSA